LIKSAYAWKIRKTNLEEPGVLWKTPPKVSQDTGIPEYDTEAMIYTLSSERDEILRSSYLDDQTRRPFYHS